MCVLYGSVGDPAMSARAQRREEVSGNQLICVYVCVGADVCDMQGRLISTLEQNRRRSHRTLNAVSSA